MRNWCCVFWARQRCLPGNEESFQLYPSNLPFNPEITPKKFSFVSFIPEVWWHSSYFLNRLDVLMNPCDIWRQKSDFFLRQRTSCMFVAICNKGFLKVNCGSRSRLALFSGKALMSEEIRASKGNMSSALLREREREKWWCTMRTNQTWTQSVRRAGECICSRCAFYIHGFSISWSALMASSFNFNQVSITANSLHMKFVP